MTLRLTSDRRPLVLRSAVGAQAPELTMPVRRLVPMGVGDVDPFVFLDHFGPFRKQPGDSGVATHPHAGIATVTYLFEGRNRHQDSLGNDVVVEAGDLALMVAGRGIVHAEGMGEQLSAPVRIDGLQLWLSLAAGDKLMAPSFHHWKADQLPASDRAGVRATVVFGEMFDMVSPAVAPADATLVDLVMSAGSSETLEVSAGRSLAVYVASGGLVVNGVDAPAGSIVELDRLGGSVQLESQETSKAIVLGGRPHDEPIVGWGPFVMNSNDQIDDAVSRYEAGEFGSIARPIDSKATTS